MIEKQLLNIQFLKNNLNMLRGKKGHYLAPAFLEQLENTAFELLKAISQKTNSPVTTLTRPVPTKISESFIDLCLDSIEGEIKKINLKAGEGEARIINELADIAYDLFCLAVYIRFTLDPLGSSAVKNVFVVSGVAKNFSSPERLN
jgi:hypothetical protein